MAFDPFMPMGELARKLQAGELTARTAVDQYLDEIERRDEEINAYVTVTEELAYEQAAAADEAYEQGDILGPLHGVPVALKDLRDMKQGVPHSFGSSLVGNLGFVAPRTSAVVERLEAAGAVIIGKTNVPEFGHKGVTQNNYAGATASPLDPTCNAGGSSGGSAAAVAGGMTSIATGSDSGGSIRIPAAACGVFGHKPSFGVVPLDARPNGFGMKMHHSVQGPLTRTVEDAAMMMDVLAGYHPRDPGSVPIDMHCQEAIDKPVSDLRIGYSPDLDVYPVEKPVADTVREAVDALEAAGATVETIDIGHGLSLDDLVEDVTTTFSSVFVGLAEVLQDELGLDIREHEAAVSDSLLQLIEYGEAKTIGDVARTGLTRTKLFDAMQDVLAEYDLLATPTLATSRMDLHSDQGLEWDLALTWPFNWTGHPAASVPAGRTDDDGVAAVQLIGMPYQDETVFAASAALERERPWQDLYPR